MGGKISILKGSGGRTDFVARAVVDTNAPQIKSQNIKFHTLAITDELADKAAMTLDNETEIRAAIEHFGISSDDFDLGSLSFRDLTRINPTDLEIEPLRLSGPAKEAALTLNKEYRLFLRAFNWSGLGFQSDDFGWDALRELVELKGNPRVHVEMHQAVEPNSRVEIQHLRSGDTKEILVDNEGGLEYSMDNIEPGDVFVMVPTDSAGNVGKTLEIRYNPETKGGNDKPLNVLGLRFAQIP